MTETPPTPDPYVRQTPMAALWALVALLVGIELLLQLGDSGYGGLSRRWVFLHGAFWNPLLNGTNPLFDLQPVTMFLTHALLHGGLFHVAMNATVILSIGKLVTDLSGPARTILLFIITAIAGGGAFALLGPQEPIPMVGASGAAFGFIAAWKRWEFDFLRATGRSIRPVATFVGGLTALNVVLHFAMGGMLAWEAHLGGAMAGWLVAPFLSRPYAGRF
ncbi:rhomboid family intramembrane serine protease [Pontivivens ytuae]|uniref:Rhomboid family intramembrane serine protease n=1 Tax=Pontivivens ytuae TaxID=2789856 RepID=A0A7S9LNS8_9RHOB|nr:rhomboid family intramembrane serine protease [Pontivivens ytuae]QPH52225.1 rhomboid family intramembrane serine protease [Pontivivens ytuae]